MYRACRSSFSSSSGPRAGGKGNKAGQKQGAGNPKQSHDQNCSKRHVPHPDDKPRRRGSCKLTDGWLLASRRSVSSWVCMTVGGNGGREGGKRSGTATSHTIKRTSSAARQRGRGRLPVACRFYSHQAAAGRKEGGREGGDFFFSILFWDSQLCISLSISVIFSHSLTHSQTLSLTHTAMQMHCNGQSIVKNKTKGLCVDPYQQPADTQHRLACMTARADIKLASR